ncbi:NAD(P)-binding protein [Aaosphaeria arxii CBS 175.79]|uniref:NAD(P)-binding protein n=1 Tax=Aaosphaeria arxii CBS 175.79 TaxID=1450172 RepID=A0A6A5Y8B9_9PLEO|nr:NAD(P)-binding protein [Aaosphaeria arxii CBS 175.79]KAF2021060.1 NAD(P)-binding protein [Aaosphaeria arxii CBS 175.79]
MAQKNHVENIAIVGAGGQIGKFIVDALLQKGKFKVTAISRQDSTNTPAPGVQIARVDYDQHESLVKALEGQDVLLITMSVGAPPDQQAKLVRAAADAGVPWVLPNEFGNDRSSEQAGRDALIGPPKAAVRNLIESLGKSKWIGIACSFWYEYSLSWSHFYGFDIQKRHVLWYDDGLQKINTSTWPQTGRGVAELLSLPISKTEDGSESATLSDYANDFVRISSFAVNQRDMFESLKRVTKTTDSDWTFDSVPAKQIFEESVQQMEKGNHSAFGRRLYSRFFFPGENAGLYEVTSGLDNEKLGLPKEDLDEFTKKSVELAESNYVGKLFGM